VVTDTLHLAVGAPGLACDAEPGPTDWTVSATENGWWRTAARCHDGHCSWYCGSPEQRYANGTEATLDSPVFVVPEKAELAFWCYFDVTIYGTDGLHVEVAEVPDSAAAPGDATLDWRTLDYLGSGGALGGGGASGWNGGPTDPLLFVTDWSEFRYDLSFLEPGSRALLRFRFVSDAVDTDEGFYVDDITVAAAVEQAVETPPVAGGIALSPTTPNPAIARAAWRLVLEEEADVSLSVFDVTGRLMHALPRRRYAPGGYELAWAGRTTAGVVAPSGHYFMRLRVGDAQWTRRIVWLGR
jgi:hypothetical protein